MSSSSLQASLSVRNDDSWKDQPSKLFPELEDLKSRLVDLVKHQDFSNGLIVLKDLVRCTKSRRLSLSEAESVSAFVDEAFQLYTRAAFASSSSNCQIRQLGADAIQLQATSSSLVAPYNQVLPRTLLYALRALTSDTSTSPNLDAAFRILQRLVTGVGVRNNMNKNRLVVSEKDFNRVLHAFCHANRLDMAHRIVALQRKTSHAPPLSPVAYSILIKAHGVHGDLAQVEACLEAVQRDDILPDTIFWNTVLDAYINCKAVDQAQALFEQLTTTSSSATTDRQRPPANRRTYNTMLKGYANAGMVQEALNLSADMKKAKLWDSITTNTLVHACLVSHDFATAHDILRQHTFHGKPQREHPNVPAYTALLDAYAKDGKLDQALGVLQLMRTQSVSPNEITYACLIAGLARHNKMNQTKKMLSFMSGIGIPPTCVTYNAMISALVGMDEASAYHGHAEPMDSRVDEALAVLRQMIQSGVHPNVVTASTIVEALGRCSPPRISVANLLIDKLERRAMIPVAHPQVVTATVRACGQAQDMTAALAAFAKLTQPDVVSINAMLDVCGKCQRESLARQTFEHYFRNQHKRSGGTRQSPDVVTYSVLLAPLLKTMQTESIARVRKLYREMQTRDKIHPDTTLIDIVLRGMLRFGRSTNEFSRKDARFVVCVLRDAESLKWEEGQLQRRKRVVRAFLSDRFRQHHVWNQAETEPTDDLFERKGWNRVDSSFTLFPQKPGKDHETDGFLSSHGWNDVDSGFRVL